jgi:hypothetical protein
VKYCTWSRPTAHPSLWRDSTHKKQKATTANKVSSFPQSSAVLRYIPIESQPSRYPYLFLQDARWVVGLDKVRWVMQHRSDLLLRFEEKFISHRSGMQHNLQRPATPIFVHTDLQYRFIVEIVTLSSCFRCLNLASSCILVHTSRHEKALNFQVSAYTRRTRSTLRDAKVHEGVSHGTARKAAYKI